MVNVERNSRNHPEFQ
ncbi:hypothetical protein A2U01_0088084, partial [Trifolium medium]|nr:hypothetical protein [Trifolium medium]